MTIRNPYKVQQRQWRKWSDAARVLFNSIYKSMYNNQDMFQHPKAAVQKKEHWKTTAWNAAWIAASGLDEYFKGDKDVD